MVFMFCCSKLLVAVTSRLQPSYKDDYSVLWLGSDKPDVSVFRTCTTLPRSSVSLSSATIYHVSSVGEFKKALLGEFFKTKVNWFRSERYEPRRFHAVIIMDWTTGNRKHIELALSDVINGYRDLVWNPPSYLVQGVSVAFIRQDFQSYLVSNSPFALQNETSQSKSTGENLIGAESPAIGLRTPALTPVVNPLLKKTWLKPSTVVPLC